MTASSSPRSTAERHGGRAQRGARRRHVGGAARGGDDDALEQPGAQHGRGTIRGATLRCMAPAVHPKRASLPLPGGSDGRGRRPSPRCARRRCSRQPRFFQRPSGPLATVRGLGLLTPKSKWTWVPVPCFLVEHPTAGPFLIDTGLPPAASHDVRAALGRRAAIVYDIRMEDGWAVTDQLVGAGPRSAGHRARGPDPHAPGPRRRGGAAAARDVRRRRARVGGGDRQRLPARLPPPALRPRLRLARARLRAPSRSDSFASFGHAIDLFGDGSVRLLSTPGHTKGHMSVLLRLQSGRELLLTGDAAYSRATIDAGARAALLRRRAPLPALAARDPPLPRARRRAPWWSAATTRSPGRRSASGTNEDTHAQPLGRGPGWEPSMPSMPPPLASVLAVLAALAVVPAAHARVVRGRQRRRRGHADRRHDEQGRRPHRRWAGARAPPPSRPTARAATSRPGGAWSPSTSPRRAIVAGVNVGRRR